MTSTTLVPEVAASADAADDAAAAAGELPVTEPEPFRGGWAETPEQTAARAAKATRARRQRRPHLLEVVLRYPHEAYLPVAGGLRDLAARRRQTVPEVVADLVAAELERAA